MAEKGIRVLWPDSPRYVTEEWVRIQASDSYYDNADWYRCRKCGDSTLTAGLCIHLGDCDPIYNDGREKPEGLHECMECLMDKGDVTFGKER